MSKNLNTVIVCSPPWDQGGGTIFGKFSSRRGNVIFEEAGGGQLQGVESRFPNHLVEELSKNQKLINETVNFKQFRAIFGSNNKIFGATRHFFLKLVVQDHEKASILQKCRLRRAPGYR